MSPVRVTINDIARTAGVSKATVSYVLNNRNSGFRISAATSMRVLAACRALDYRRDEAAVQLSECRKTPLKILLASPWLYASFSDFTAQVNKVLQDEQRRSLLAVSYCSFQPGELNFCLRASVLKRYDAVLIMGTSAKDEEWLGRHAAALGKVVLMNRCVDGLLSSFGNDREAVAELAGKIDLKHYARLVCCLSSRQSFCENMRCEGFMAGVAACGRKAEMLCLQNWEQLYDELLPLAGQGPLLVFVPQYVPAAALLKRAAESGVKVPEELGIAAYDLHSLLSRFIAPDLTTVDPHLTQMAQNALSLARGVREMRQQTSIPVSGKLILGGTTVNLS